MIKPKLVSEKFSINGWKCKLSLPLKIIHSFESINSGDKKDKKKICYFFPCLISSEFKIEKKHRLFKYCFIIPAILN